MKKFKDIIIGMILVVVGIIFIGNTFDLWKIDIFFEGWWTLFILVPSVIGLFQQGSRTSSLLGIIIGTLLLLAARDVIAWNIVGKVFLPTLLIIIGLSIIFRRNIKDIEGVKAASDSYTAVFSGLEQKVPNEKFKGTNITAIFGGVELDLRNAIIDEDIVINCTTVFGGIDLFMPENVKIKTKGIPVFGGVDNKKVDATGDAKTVYINYTCAFAGIDIK